MEIKLCPREWATRVDSCRSDGTAQMTHLNSASVLEFFLNAFQQAARRSFKRSDVATEGSIPRGSDAWLMRVRLEVQF